MNLIVAPAKSPLTSSAYNSQPLTMSLPTWANGPVIGAMKPTRISSATALAIPSWLIAIARLPAINIPDVLTAMVFTPPLLEALLLVRLPASSLPPAYRTVHQTAVSARERPSVRWGDRESSGRKLHPTHTATTGRA